MDASRLIPLLAAAAVIFFAFQINWVLGLAAIAVLLGYSAWSNRAGRMALKAQQASAAGDLKTAVRLMEEAVRLSKKSSPASWLPTPIFC